jgi:hypothetical protein
LIKHALGNNKNIGRWLETVHIKSKINFGYTYAVHNTLHAVSNNKNIGRWLETVHIKSKINFGYTYAVHDTLHAVSTSASKEVVKLIEVAACSNVVCFPL